MSICWFCDRLVIASSERCFCSATAIPTIQNKRPLEWVIHSFGTKALDTNTAERVFAFTEVMELLYGDKSSRRAICLGDSQEKYMIVRYSANRVDFSAEIDGVIITSSWQDADVDDLVALFSYVAVKLGGGTQPLMQRPAPLPAPASAL